MRHIEQIAFGMALASLEKRENGTETNPAWVECMEEMSETNRVKFQNLVYHTKGFRDYFEKATPIRELALMRLGSRPVSRGGTIDIEDIRAIPWNFSWTQNRHLLPGWYPIGYALDSALRKRKHGIQMLRDMYDNWLFFRTVIDNEQMVLIKADLMIAESILRT